MAPDEPMLRRPDIGLWRSTLGDTWPHTHVDQATQAELPDFLRNMPGSCFGRWRGAKARWQIVRAEVRPGDVFVLASGVRDCGLTAADLAGELARTSAGTGARELASRLGKLAVRLAGGDRRPAWSVTRGSRSA